MTIAYPDDLANYAVTLSKFGFNTVRLKDAHYYDALIYKLDNRHFLSSIHPDKEILFLDVSNISPKNAALILDSGLYSPLF